MFLYHIFCQNLFFRTRRRQATYVLRLAFNRHPSVRLPHFFSSHFFVTFLLKWMDWNFRQMFIPICGMGTHKGVISFHFLKGAVRRHTCSEVQYTLVLFILIINCFLLQTWGFQIRTLFLMAFQIQGNRNEMIPIMKWQKSWYTIIST